MQAFGRARPVVFTDLGEPSGQGGKRLGEFGIGGLDLVEPGGQLALGPSREAGVLGRLQSRPFESGPASIAGAAGCSLDRQLGLAVSPPQGRLDLRPNSIAVAKNGLHQRKI